MEHLGGLRPGVTLGETSSKAGSAAGDDWAERRVGGMLKESEYCLVLISCLCYALFNIISLFIYIATLVIYKVIVLSKRV